MRTWLILLGGLLVWTAHFFGIYIAASLFPGTEIARWLTGALTLAALGALAVLGWRTSPIAGDGLSSWLSTLSLAGIALAAVAVLYQGVTALF